MSGTRSGWVVRPGEPGFDDESRVGGKARGLARLVAAGAEVPPWFAVPSEAFADHLARAGLVERIERELARLADLTPGPGSLAAIEAIGSSLAGAVESTPLAGEVAAAVAAALENIGPGPFAVRSSMVGEDSQRHSFAGQLESFLYRDAPGEVQAALIRCWASAFGARVLAYRHRVGERGVPAMGVVVQQMAAGEVSGVLFTADPVAGRNDRALLTACWGLGEGVVGGACNADEYVWAHRGAEVSARVVDKDVRLVRDPAGGTREEPVPAALRAVRCLEPGQVARVCREGLRLAAALGSPLDIEWTLAGDRLALLQARPITSPLGSASGPRMAWDASNIQENYAGVTTPLTYSFVSRFYQVPLGATLIALGVPEDAVDAMPAGVRRGLIGLLGGRIYYQTDNWMRVMMMMPAFREKQRFFEAALGVTASDDLAEPDRRSLADRLRREVGGRLVMTLRFAVMERSVRAFLDDFERDYRRIDRGSLAAAKLDRLVAMIDELRVTFLDQWHRSNINDFYMMMSSGRLREILMRAAGAEAPRYFGQLVHGADAESAEQARMMLRMAGAARRSPELVEAITEGRTAEALARVRESCPELAALLTDYLERYGDRCMGELKLESVTLRDDPQVVLRVLRNYLEESGPAVPSGDPAGQAERELAARLGWRERLELRRAVRATRLAIRLRESTRIARTRMFGLHRDLFRAIGRRLHESGRFDEPRDIFYLTVDEILAYCEGTAVSADLRAIVRARREEFGGYQQREAPQRLETRGVPYEAPELSGSAGADLADITADARVLRGLGCSAGVAESELRVILTPHDDLSIRGRILTTERTDPGWAPLFPAATGILVERGNMLSHSAVLARELGIPAVVGIPGLLRIVSDGERVRLDGAAGTVERLGQVDAAAGDRPGQAG